MFCTVDRARIYINKHISVILLIIIIIMALYWTNTKIRYISIGLGIIIFLAHWIAYNYANLYSDKNYNNGGWGGESQYLSHQFREDPGLANGLYNFFKHHPNDSILDLGCGNGSYIQYLASKGIKNVKCIDTYESSLRNPKFIQQGDLSKQIDYSVDWIMSFEVGEHIPKQYERIFIENITKNARKGIIMSWAEVGHGGDGHVNELDIDEVIKKITEYGFELDTKMTNSLRMESNKKCYFKRNLLVFRRL